ncbi:MAG: xanthine dehydrogenase family protein molybdopterin-binding subunit [Desulfarculaceae bacterium]|nr:xanthine dehydrogenase family protein molybdopterin-binding subunit [Desulfarculaceae bacterium]MCF8073431.1 xanthine dehydrogenase family protein molybdopterin-binding subunit [Desulfarculaceae bacterium]MCF8100422.1 xanthine dehydrogenase family protein molybdopterin-binding subunit [Desulfarculaceae bacterium]
MSVGHSMPHSGVYARVRGETRFGWDQQGYGDLHLACVRAELAPAHIKSIDPAPALALPGVVRVFTAADVPGEHNLGIIAVSRDQEFLARDTVRQRGQAVALVAAETRAQALAGARAVRVELDKLPGVFTPAEALASGAPLVHPDHADGNLLRENKIKRGEVDAALAASAVTVEAVYSTSPLEHAALEPEGGRAWWQGGKLVVQACTQNPHYDQADLARFLNVPQEKIRVIQAETGGGFGGKLDLSVQPFLALAAWHLVRSVCMRFTREESFLATAKRHPLRMHYISGADEQGRLTALKARILGDTGAFASYGLAVCMRAAVHATGPYHVPNLDVACRMAYTNNGFYGAMRGFGCPQVALAHEGQMDALAAKLGLDPLEMRKINALQAGMRTCTGQKLTAGVGLMQCLERIEPIYRAWREEAPAQDGLSGVGLGAMFYGIGNTGVSNPSTAQMEWGPDNTVTLFTGAADIGQGSDTVLKQIAAGRLGIEAEQIKLCRGDTARTTNAGATSASRQTYISGNAALAAADNLVMNLVEGAREMLGERHLEIELREGMLRASDGRAVEPGEVARHMADQGGAARGEGAFDPNFSPLDPETGQGRPYAAYAYAAQCAKVAVDPASGMTRVKEVAAAHDVGRAINPRAVLGQICGGVVMGVGMALMEEHRPGREGNLQQYHIPTAADAPAITPLIVEDPEPTGPFGAKGVGEPALIPTAPAVAAAVSQAVGKPLRHLPLSLERVMEALSSRGESHED